MLAAKDKENADKPKFRKLLSKSDLLAAAPPPVFLKQRSALAPRQDNTNVMSASIHGGSNMPKFQLKSDQSNAVSRSIHTINPALVMQKPKPTTAGNAFTFDLKSGSNNTVQPIKAVVASSKFSNPLLLPKQQPPIEPAPVVVVKSPPCVVKSVSPPPSPMEVEPEVVDPTVALQMRRQAEMQRKGADMVSRARALEAEGKTAAALALFKESLHYFPTNDKLALRVETLKSKLLEERTTRTVDTSTQQQQSQDLEDDALEAMFMETSINNNNSPIKKAAAAPRRARTSSIYEEDSGLSANQQLVNRLNKLSKQRGNAVPLCRFVDNYLEVERVHSNTDTTEFQRVRFHAMDCAVTPPSTRVETDEEMDTQLYPVEQVIDRLAQCAKMIDEAKRGSSNLTLLLPEFFQALQGHPYGPFLACTASVSLGLQCLCDGRCKLHAIPVRDRLSQLLSTGMRCVLRRLFNSSSSSVALVANTGSYRFAGDDVAAVVHRALLLLDTRLQLVDKVVLLGTQSSRVDVEDLGRVGEFVQAHQFLMEMFPTDEACSMISDCNQAAWAKFRKYLAVAREFKLHDELVLAPLANLHDFVSQLKQQAPLVKACRGHVDFAYRIALREDKCGQCTCEGARRRRANAMGMWMAPTLQRTSSTASAKCHVEKCTACSQAVVSGGISCECCEKQFHTSCLGLPKGYESDFVCGKCMPKFNNTRQ